MYFLAELGGTMGMLIGASWISIGELLVFYFAFFVLIIKYFYSKLFGKSQTVRNSEASNPTKNELYHG